MVIFPINRRDCAYFCHRCKKWRFSWNPESFLLWENSHKNIEKIKKLPKNYSGDPVFLVQVGQLAPLYQSPGNHWSSNLVKTSIFMSKTPKNAWFFRFDGDILEKIAIKNSHLDQLFLVFSTLLNQESFGDSEFRPACWEAQSFWGGTFGWC